MLIRIVLPWACFGLIIENNTVIEAAPIAGWSVGKPVREVLGHFKRKGALIELVGVG